MTVSRSKISNSSGCTPYRGLAPDIVAAEGAYLIAANGQRVLDLGNCFGTVLLGHRDPDVDAAVKRMQESGVPAGAHLGLAEAVADRLTVEFPFAASIAFFMTGTTATCAAAAIARAASGRQLILSAGYHGWHPMWSAAATLWNANEHDVVDFFYIPEMLEQQIKAHRDRVACCIISPDYVHLHSSTLAEIFELCRRHNVMIVVDDVKYAYRIRNGVSIRGLGLEADLYVVAKGIANGAPLSCVIGPSDLMAAACSFASTQTLYGPLYAAALATLDKLAKLDVQTSIERSGQTFISAARELLTASRLPISLFGRGAAFQFAAGTVELDAAFHAEMTTERVFLELGDQQFPSLAFAGEVITDMIGRLERGLARLIRRFPELRGKDFSYEARLRAAWNQMDGVPDFGDTVEARVAFVASNY